MIQSQPKLCDFVSLSDTYIQVATHFKNSMRIKNKKTNIPYSLTYREWRTEYIQKNKYIHFDIVNYNDVVELHVIDKETGELKFNQILDKKEAENNVRKNSTTQYIKPLSFEYYDKNLVYFKVYNYSGLSFFKRLLKRIKQIIKPKKNPAKIPFTRAESMQIKIGIWAIAIAIIVPIVILFIEKKCF